MTSGVVGKKRRVGPFFREMSAGGYVGTRGVWVFVGKLVQRPFVVNTSSRRRREGGTGTPVHTKTQALSRVRMRKHGSDGRKNQKR